MAEHSRRWRALAELHLLWSLSLYGLGKDENNKLAIGHSLKAWPILDVLDLGFQIEHAWRAARLSATLRVSSLNEVVRIIANEVLGD